MTEKRNQKREKKTWRKRENDKLLQIMGLLTSIND